MASVYGDWKVVRSLSEGGQAHIFLVEHVQDKRIGVLKRLKNLKRYPRFKTEFEIMRAHGDGQRFFPEILDANLEAEQPYFVMEYFEAGCLTLELIRTWSLDDKLRFYFSLLLAMAYTHNERVIHRDLKPGNILVTNDKLAKVTDFGLCYLDEGGTRHTLLDEAVGSFNFMAPEMEDGRADSIGPQADVYSLGKVAYWLFAGKIYAREKHREPQFDISKEGNGESWRYFLNDFLDNVTDPNPARRPKGAAEALIAFKDVVTAIRDHVRYLDLRIEQRCAFCRSGTYRIAVNTIKSGNPTEVHNFGFSSVGNAKWLIMCCDRCGNVQAFRKDTARKWSWKEG